MNPRDDEMEKPAMITGRFAILISIFLCILLLSLNHSFKDAVTFSLNKQVNPFFSYNKNDSCTGRYVFIHNLPPRFNFYFLQHCESLTRGTDKPNMCPYMDNMGLGPQIKNSENSEEVFGVFTNKSWFATNQFLLEVIFHNRMRKYACLTNDSSLASAIFVPFYAGLDVSRFLWVSNLTERDSSGQELLQWVSRRPEWKRMWGRDHFLVSGRISWDFRRQFDDVAYWGSKFRFFPESNNMSMLAVEGSSWKNDYAIPYPTSFHPSKQSAILQWQSEIRVQKRPHLFTFTGAPRPELDIRGKIIDQCRSSIHCRFIDCSYGREECDNPVNVMKVFKSSVFCLQPPGDSYTRRSLFDSMLAGCIPVFFHPGSAYSQYQWFLPKERVTKYSVYIPVKDVKVWNVSVEKVLLEIPKDEVFAMREEVIELIPNIIYADPRFKLDGIEDAFNLAVKGILDRIEKVREDIRNGRDPGIGFADEDHYKYTFSDNHT